MTTTIEPADPAAPDDEQDGATSSNAKAVLGLVAAGLALLAGLAVAAFAIVNDPPDAPRPVVEAVPVAPTPSATPTPEEQFLKAWHAAAPGVAARRSDDYWSRLGVATCNMIGRPFITEDMVLRVLSSSPQVMSFDEGRTFLEVAHAQLCAGNEYAPELASPTVGPVSRVELPDFGSASVPRGTSSIPTMRVSPPSVRSAPTIPGTSSDGGSSSGGGSSSRPDVQPAPRNPLQPQPVG